MSTNPPGPEQTPPSYPPAPPAYSATPGYPPPAGYPSAPPPAGQYGAPPQATPGRTLGIVALVLAFVASLVGVILGIVALVQSRRAGQKNGFAVAAIIIGSVLFVIGCIVLIIVIGAFAAQAADLLRFCQEAGPGPQEYNGLPIDCTDIIAP